MKTQNNIPINPNITITMKPQTHNYTRMKTNDPSGSARHFHLQLATARHALRSTMLLLFCLLAGTFAARAGSPPVVANVTAVQNAPTDPHPKYVHIYYDISDPDSTSVSVNFLVSQDSGATWTVPAKTFISAEGAFGPNVVVSSTPRTYDLFWDAGTDWDGNYTTHCRVRVLANDENLMLIPAGTYTRGNSSGDADITDAPVFPVYVSAFYMDSTLVTGGKWNFVVQTYASTHGYTFNDSGGATYFKAANHPVQGVDWYDAVKWCNARSEMEGLIPAYYIDAGCTVVYKTGQVAPFAKAGVNGFRLPTEAEWEKAARGGLSGKRFPLGDTISEDQANYTGDTSLTGNANIHYDLGPNGYNAAWHNGTTPFTSQVGSFAPNGYGLYDMAGNADEWCWDVYDPAAYVAGQTDPQGPSSGDSRVVRGGEWNDFANHARCADRSNNQLPNSAGGFGFRCVRGL
jgi:formylglycine-generating enzyme required for sulfatase activity